MVDPVSVSMVVCTILSVVQQIGNAALTARQNKKECSALADRARNLGQALPSFAGAVAENDPATAYVLARLSDALGRALSLIESCQAGGFRRRFNVGQTATDLENVRSTINDCLADLGFFSIARAHAMSTHAAAQTYHHSSYHHHQAQGGAHVAWPPQHASQGYFHGVPRSSSSFLPSFSSSSSSFLPSFSSSSSSFLPSFSSSFGF